MLSTQELSAEDRTKALFPIKTATTSAEDFTLQLLG